MLARTVAITPSLSSVCTECQYELSLTNSIATAATHASGNTIGLRFMMLNRPIFIPG